jgi:SagB-type dehydrogenase family enzyme
VRFAGIVLAGMLACEAACLAGQAPELRLPAPQRDGKVSLERCLATRRSVRAYRDDALKLAELSQLLWAAQGITGGERLRTAPSAGALYPLEVYVLAGSVEGLAAGIYKYRPERHELVRVAQEDRRRALAEAALGQQFIAQAPAVFVIAGVYERTARRYGDRAPRYVHIEVGHAGQKHLLAGGGARAGQRDGRRLSRSRGEARGGPGRRRIPAIHHPGGRPR